MPHPGTLNPEVLFEDDLVLAVNKPCGAATARAGSADAPGLSDWLLEHRGRGVACAHRLDTEASGVVLCAKTKAALDFLSGQFQAKTARRVYAVLVAVIDAAPGSGAFRGPGGALPEAFALDAPLADAGRGPVRVNRGRGGRPCATECRVLEAFGRFAWLECRPLTGCRHQVRVHLADAGLPVLNDPVYGVGAPQLLLSELKRGYKGRDEERPLIARLALHGAAVEFVHPGTRQAQTIGAALPSEFGIALKYLRRFSIAATRAAARPARR